MGLAGEFQAKGYAGEKVLRQAVCREQKEGRGAGGKREHRGDGQTFGTASETLTWHWPRQQVGGGKGRNQQTAQVGAEWTGPGGGDGGLVGSLKVLN